jgi:hypothetical protein
MAARWRFRRYLLVAVLVALFAVGFAIFWPTPKVGGASLTVMSYRTVSNRTVARLIITNGPTRLRFAGDKYSVAWSFRSTPSRFVEARARAERTRPPEPKISRLTVTNISKTMLGPAETATIDVWLPQKPGIWKVKLRFHEGKLSDFLPAWIRGALAESMRRGKRVELTTGPVVLAESMLPDS